MTFHLRYLQKRLYGLVMLNLNSDIYVVFQREVILIFLRFIPRFIGAHTDAPSHYDAEGVELIKEIFVLFGKCQDIC